MTTLIDLASDTKTRPTTGMRAAMAAAEVGDERANEDPTVNRLVERCAALLGKEAAVFLPSGTMANEIALLQYPPAAASAVVLIIIVSLMVAAILRIVDLRRELQG